MSFLAGIVIALVVSLSETVVGFDKDRAFYPTLLAVIASYYGLFAVMSGSAQAVLAESFAIATFLGAAVLGFKRGLWVVVAALLAHGIFDFFYGRFISNSGVPLWWPMFCLTYDVTAGTNHPRQSRGFSNGDANAAPTLCATAAVASHLHRPSCSSRASSSSWCRM